MLKQSLRNWVNREVRLDARESIFTSPFSNVGLNTIGFVLNFVLLAKILSYIQAFNRLVLVSKEVLEIRLMGTLVIFILTNVLYGFLLCKISYEKKILRFSQQNMEQKIVLGRSRAGRPMNNQEESTNEKEE